MFDRLKFNPSVSYDQSSIVSLLLRIAGGGLMLIHGFPKLMKLINGEMGFVDPIGFGPEFSLVLTVFAEFICAVLILIGLFTRYATIPLIVTMLVAAFVVHGADPMAKKELALIYFIIYTTILILGSGKYSFDSMISRNR